MIKKIILLLSLLFLLTGIASATDLNDFKLPSDFKTETEYYAINGDYGLSIIDYDKETSYDLFFENDTGYIVNIINNQSNYTDNSINQVGCMEIVHIDDSDVLIEVYSNNSDIKRCNDYMNEFNKMNNLQSEIIKK